MIEQYTKFLKMAIETKWRGDVAGLTYIETSTLWRQEHNGYSHQNPGVCGFLVKNDGNRADRYLSSLVVSSLFLVNLLGFISQQTPTPVSALLIIVFVLRTVSFGLGFRVDSINADVHLLDISLIVGSKNPTQSFLSVEEVGHASQVELSKA